MAAALEVWPAEAPHRRRPGAGRARSTRTLADTAAFCEAYGIGHGRVGQLRDRRRPARREITRYAACVVLATTRADVNGVVRRLLDARKASFAPMDEAVRLTGMEYGGITPIGLPEGLAGAGRRPGRRDAARDHRLRGPAQQDRHRRRRRWVRCRPRRSSRASPTRSAEPARLARDGFHVKPHRPSRRRPRGGRSRRTPSAASRPPGRPAPRTCPSITNVGTLVMPSSRASRCRPAPRRRRRRVEVGQRVDSSRPIAVGDPGQRLVRADVDAVGEVRPLQGVEHVGLPALARRPRRSAGARRRCWPRPPRSKSQGQPVAGGDRGDVCANICSTRSGHRTWRPSPPSAAPAVRTGVGSSWNAPVADRHLAAVALQRPLEAALADVAPRADDVGPDLDLHAGDNPGS